jgi:hypothetical protein
VTSLHRLILAGTIAMVSTVAMQARAGQVTAPFYVRAALQNSLGSSSPNGSAFCRVRNMPGAYGAVVTVVCATGTVVEIGPPANQAAWEPIHGGAYRFLPPVSLAGVMSGDSDMSTGLGTVTSWRVFKVAGRDFLEMTVRW